MKSGLHIANNYMQAALPLQGGGGLPLASTLRRRLGAALYDLYEGVPLTGYGFWLRPEGGFQFYANQS